MKKLLLPTQILNGFPLNIKWVTPCYKTIYGLTWDVGCRKWKSICHLWISASPSLNIKYLPPLKSNRSSLAFNNILGTWDVNCKKSENISQMKNYLYLSKYQMDPPQISNGSPLAIKQYMVENKMLDAESWKVFVICEYILLPAWISNSSLP